MFSKTCEYGIRAAIYITLQSLKGNRVSLKDIAKEIESPESFTAKILQQLAKAKIVKSIKGPYGGFTIDDENATAVKLIDIVDTLDGDKIFNGCALGLKECNANKPCPLHDSFVEIRDDLERMLRNTSLRDMSEGLTEGLTFLKR